MAVQSLKCRSAGPSTRWAPRFSAGAASGRSRSDTTTAASTPRRRTTRSRRLHAGSGATRAPALRGPAGRPAGTGLTPLVRADRLPERLGLGEVWIRTTRQTRPIPSRPGRRRRHRQGQGAGFETVACASTASSPTPLPPVLRRRALTPSLRPLRPGGAEAARVGHLRHQAGWHPRHYDDVDRTLHALWQERPSAFVNVDLVPATRRDRDALVRDDRAAGLGAARRIVGPIASARCSPSSAGYQRVVERAWSRGELPTFSGAQAEGCSPVATAFADGVDAASPETRHDRQEPRDRRSRATGPTRSIWRATPAAPSSP